MSTIELNTQSWYMLWSGRPNQENVEIIPWSSLIHPYNLLCTGEMGEEERECYYPTWRELGREVSLFVFWFIVAMNRDELDNYNALEHLRKFHIQTSELLWGDNSIKTCLSNKKVSTHFNRNSFVTQIVPRAFVENLINGPRPWYNIPTIRCYYGCRGAAVSSS